MSDTVAAPDGAALGGDGKTILGHPRGLFVLFFTEMWERFSYYGMRALLIFYLTQHFLFSDERSALIYGAYAALVYVMTVIGGTLADRYLGQRKAVTFGAILLVFGHFGMAFEGSGSKEFLIVDGEFREISYEGRGDNRQLFIEEDGAARRLMFNPVSYATLESADGTVKRLTPINDEGEGDYAVVKRTRRLAQNICNSLGLPCRGPEPQTLLTFKDGKSYEVTTPEGADIQTVAIDGQAFIFEEATDVNINILESADRAKEPTAAVLKTIPDGSYATEVEQERLFVNILYLSLALIIAGVGFLKANISTIVGALYEVGDKRRDSGFTIFYMGINLGAFASSILCGWLGIAYGWKYGFGLAGFGMLFGLLIFLRYHHLLEGRAEPPDAEKLKNKILGPVTLEWACYLTGLLMIGLSMFLVMNEELVGGILGPIGLAMLAFLIGYAFVKLSGDERDRMLAAIYVMLAQIPFWALFEQAGSSLNLFTDRLVNRTAFGGDVPAAVFQSLNAGFIFIFAPIIAWMWVALAKRNREPSTPVKLAIGVFLVGLGFLALVGGMESSGAVGLTPVYFIFLIYWVHTMGELMLSPVGLSAITKLAPARVVGMAMGGWFLFSGLSNYLAGVIARATGAETIGGQVVNVAATKAGYASVYADVGYAAVGISIFMLIVSPFVKRMMRGA